MGNGACERLNQTLLKMLGCHSEDKKSHWKDYLGNLVLAYNCTPHETTGFTPYQLMFGRNPRLPVDNRFQTWYRGNHDDLSTYVEDVRQRLEYCHNLAHEKMAEAAEHSGNPKQISVLQPGDNVLVKKLAFQGRSKLADKWESEVYRVVNQPNDDIPVYTVKRIDGRGKSRTLHRNVLRPISSPEHLPSEGEEEEQEFNNILMTDTPRATPSQERPSQPLLVEEFIPNQQLDTPEFDFDIIIEDADAEETEEEVSEAQPRRTNRQRKSPDRFTP